MLPPPPPSASSQPALTPGDLGGGPLTLLPPGTPGRTSHSGRGRPPFCSCPPPWWGSGHRQWEVHAPQLLPQGKAACPTVKGPVRASGPSQTSLCLVYQVAEVLQSAQGRQRWYMGNETGQPLPDLPTICSGFIFAGRPPRGDQETDVSLLLTVDLGRGSLGLSFCGFVWQR